MRQVESSLPANPTGPMLGTVRMRFGLLGPANGDLAALEKGARLLLFEHAADEVMYLGPDDALDRVALDWVRSLVGEDPSETGVWRRAAERCSKADPKQIDEFLRAEFERDRLKALRCLPGAASRTIEILEGHLAVLLYDKALLDEEDILPASLLIFGRSAQPVFRPVGQRTFISPGDLGQGQGQGGVMLLSSVSPDALELLLLRPDGEVLAKHSITCPSRAAKLRVVGPRPNGERT